MAEVLEGLLARGFEVAGRSRARLPEFQQARTRPQLEEILLGEPETHTLLSVDNWTVERLDEHPDVLAVSGPKNLRVETEHVWQRWHDAVALVVNENDCPVVSADDLALVIQRLSGDLDAISLDQPAPFPTAEGCVGLDLADGWLAEELATALGLGPGGHALAVGHHLRLTDRAMTVEAMLAGSPADDPTDGWFGSLRPRHRRELHGWFVAEIVRVGDLLTEAEQLDPLTFDRMFADLARGRDDLESLREVLWRTGLFKTDDELADLDERMRAFLISQPFEVELADARLARARRVDPGAWWARSATQP